MNTFNEYPQGQRGEHESTRHHEGKVARAIEKRTSAIPSDAFLWAAGAAIVGSLALQIYGLQKSTRIGMFQPSRMMTRAPLSTFVGQWAPTLLLLGIYNKIVKVMGSDRFER